MKLPKIAKNKKFIIGILIVLIIGGYYWYSKTKSATKQVQYITATAEKGTLITSVSASGSMIVDNSASVDPTINGTVNNLSVNVGDSVKKGQLLFSIVNDQLGVTASQASTSYSQAISSLESSEASKKQASANLSDAKKSGSGKSAADKRALSEQNDAARKAVTAAQSNVNSVAANLSYQRQQAGKRNVISPMDGTVNAVSIKNGDNLGASSSTHVAPIIIGDLGTLKAQVQVNEVDVSNVIIGQKATMTFDALSEFTATGKIEKMDSLGTTTQGVVTYSVTISFDSLDPRIKPDMSVTAAIITSAKQNVITVPLSAVKTQNGNSFVEVLNGPTPTQVPVAVGASNGTDTEITGGVSVGDKVVTQTINPTATSTSTNSTARSTTGGGGGTRIPGLGGGGFGGGR